MASAKYSSSITLKNVEIGFVHLADPTPKMNNDGMEYSCQVIVPKDHPQAPKLIQMMKEGIETAFGDLDENQRSKLKIGLRDNDKEGNSKKYEYLQNTFFFNSKRQVKKGQIPAVNAANAKINPFTSESIFSGCIVNIVCNFYSYNHPGSRGIACSCEAIQIVNNVDVVRRDGSPDVSNAFEALSDDENVNNFVPKTDAAAGAEQAPAAAQMGAALQNAMPEEGMATDSDLPW